MLNLLTVCNLVKEGVTGIFAPTQFQTREVVLSICSKLEIPVIEYAYHPREELKDQKTVLNFYPDNKYISKVSYHFFYFQSFTFSV